MSDPVHFLFLGNAAENIPSRPMHVERRYLRAKSKSLLSVLATDVWNEDKSKGKTRSNPIITRPLESLKDSWVPEVSGMIEQSYAGWELVLPAKVELEEALTVLDYYGLTVDDPRTISLDATDRQTRLRARIFLENSKNYKKSLDFILQSVESCPRYERKFVFVNKFHNMDYINEENTSVYTAVGPRLDDSFEWVKQEGFRDKLVSDLEADGLTGTWARRHGLGICVAGPSRENPYDDREPRYENLHVLHVTVPQAEPAAKRQRLDDSDDSSSISIIM